MRAEAGDRTRLPNVQHGALHFGLRLLSLALLALLLALLVRFVVPLTHPSALQAGGVGPGLEGLMASVGGVVRGTAQRLLGGGGEAAAAAAAGSGAV